MIADAEVTTSWYSRKLALPSGVLASARRPFRSRSEAERPSARARFSARTSASSRRTVVHTFDIPIRSVLLSQPQSGRTALYQQRHAQSPPVPIPGYAHAEPVADFFGAE